MSAAPTGGGPGQCADSDIGPPPPAEIAGLRPFTWRDLTGVVDAPRVCLRLGATRLKVEEQRGLRAGSVVRLDAAVEEPVEIISGSHVLGYGRIVLVDGKLAVQVTTRRQPTRRAEVAVGTTTTRE